jgi:hypothetical protein
VRQKIVGQRQKDEESRFVFNIESINHIGFEVETSPISSHLFHLELEIQVPFELRTARGCFVAPQTENLFSNKSTGSISRNATSWLIGTPSL